MDDEDTDETNGFLRNAAKESLVGLLDSMCSDSEARLRSETRQIDKFEMVAVTASQDAQIDIKKAVKKYQRSSADKKYVAAEVRSPSACWRSLEYLVRTVLDFDINPKPGFAQPCYSASFFDIYSFLRDRLRAVRVDLHVQNLITDPIFIKVHEYCLRFELLSLFLLWGRDFGGPDTSRRFDLHLSLTALSQTIDPLTNAYSSCSDPTLLSSQPEITKYILLLSLTSRNGAKTFKGHYLGLSERVRNTSEVRFAFDAVMDFYSENHAAFLSKFSQANFLTSCSMLPVINTARTRLLWTMVRTNRPFFMRMDSSKPGPSPPPRPEKVNLALLSRLIAYKTDDECKSFLQFNGLDVTSHNSFCCIPPRQLTKDPITWWTSSNEWRQKTLDQRPFQEFAWEPSLEVAFHKRLGEDASHNVSSDYPKSIESVISEKYTQLIARASRYQIVSGSPENFENLEKEPQTVSLKKDSGSVTILPPPPPKPVRPSVPLQPLIFSDPPPPTPQDVLKRSRESPEKISPPPTAPLSGAMSLSNSETKPPPKRRVPVPAPTVLSGFDILAQQLSDIVISGPSLVVAAPETAQNDAREVEIGVQRSKFVALKCIRAWRTFTDARSKWKVLFGDKKPHKLN